MREHRHSREKSEKCFIKHSTKPKNANGGQNIHSSNLKNTIRSSLFAIFWPERASRSAVVTRELKKKKRLASLERDCL
jgi:hypothetical protein